MLPLFRHNVEVYVGFRFLLYPDSNASNEDKFDIYNTNLSRKIPSWLGGEAIILWTLNILSTECCLLLELTGLVPINIFEGTHCSMFNLIQVKSLFYSCVWF